MLPLPAGASQEFPVLDDFDNGLDGVDLPFGIAHVNIVAGSGHAA
jgi:hypothetical protein